MRNLGARNVVLEGCLSVLLLAAASMAADVGVGASKLIVIDKLVAADKAKTVFVSKDAAADKGSGTDVNSIDVSFDFFYAGEGGPTAGRFILAPGEINGTDGWLVNKDTVAKYVNKDAPAGATGAKVAVIKPEKLLKVIGKSLGDDPIDVVGAGAPVGDVCAVYTVANGGDVRRHCTAFAQSDVSFKVIGCGSGRKLVAKNGMPDGACTLCGGGAPTTTSSTLASTTSTVTTTSTSTTSIPSGTCGNGSIEPPETCDDGNLDDTDPCPADCVVDACTPVVGGTLVNAVLSFQSPGVPIAGLEILIDYPEGRLDYASAQPLVSGFFPPQDFGHALFVVRASATGIPSGPVLRTRYNACMGVPAPMNEAFGCQVLFAVDGATNPVEGVTCTVTLE